MQAKNEIRCTVSVMIDQQTFFRNLGTQIAQLRKDRGWSQSELGEKVGVSQQIVASYEKGQREHLPLCRLVALAEVFGIEISEFLLGEGASRKPGPISRMERQIEQVRRLPKAKQRFVSELLENVLK